MTARREASKPGTPFLRNDMFRLREYREPIYKIVMQLLKFVI